MKKPFVQQLREKLLSVNESARVVSLGLNDRALSGDDWEQIAPFGDFPDSQNPRLIQRFNRTQAEIMKRNFDSVLSKLGRLFRGVPIYVGHPYQLPDIYKDRRRLGKVMELQVREDGLYGRIEWNNLGRENMQEGYWVYPTPGWFYPRPERGQSIILPDELDHVGLTNQPNITSSRPWTNNEAAQGAASAAEEAYAQATHQTTEQPTTNEETNMLDKFKQMLGFNADEEAKEDALIARLQQVQESEKQHKTMNEKLMGHFKKLAKSINDAMGGSTWDDASVTPASSDNVTPASINEAAIEKFIGEVEGFKPAELAINERPEYKDLEGQLAIAQQKFETERSARIGQVLDIAINEGRITKAEREGYEGELKADFDGTCAKLSKRQMTLNTRGIDLSRAKADMTDEKGVQRQILAAVNERMAKNKEDYSTAYAAVQRSEEHKELFVALENFAKA